MKIDTLKEPLLGGKAFANLLATKVKKAVSNWVEDIISTELETQRGNHGLHIKYYEEEKLIPAQIQVSGRYVAILFDPENGRSQIHLLHRYTHEVVKKLSITNTVMKFYLYDPLDIINEHDRQSTDAYIITQLNRISENHPHYIRVYRLGSNVSSFEVPYEESQKFGDVMVSPDFEYLAICSLQWESKEDHKGNEWFSTMMVQFYSTKGDALTLMSTYEYPSYLNHNTFFPTAIFVNGQPRALVSIPGKFVALVDIEEGTVLNDFQITDKIHFSYQLDKQKYYMVSLESSNEYKIKVKQDNMEVEEVNKPIGFFNADKTGGLCVSECPYRYCERSMFASYNKEGQCGFILQQNFFNIVLKDIKFSRAVFLPGCKVFYAVKSVEPFETYVLDLHNLDIKYGTTTLTESHLCAGIPPNSQNLVIDDLSYVGLESYENLTSIQPFSEFLEQAAPSVPKLNARSFKIQGNLIVVRDNYTMRIIDLDQKREIFSHTGVDIQLSSDSTAFILNSGGMNYSYWRFDQSQSIFVKTIPSFYFSINRIDFLPGSNNKLMIFDEISNSLIELNTDTHEITKHIQNCSFNSFEYFLVSDDIISYPEKVQSGKKISMVTHIYNIRGQFPDMSYKHKLLLAQLSYDKKYLYLSTEQSVKIYHADNLKTEIQTYPVANVTRIIETKDATYLISKAGRHANKIMKISTIQPHLARFFSSGKILQRYIFDVLNNPETQQAEAYQAVEAYTMFHEKGMVDTYQGMDGHTMIHYLIQHHPSNVLQQWFESGKGLQHYIRRGLDNSSPLKFAYQSGKTSHLAVMLEYFNENPQKIQIDDEDFKFLMTSPLVAAHTFITNLFTEPTLYKCALPFSERTEQDLFVTQVPFYNIGSGKSKELASYLHSEGGEDRILSYCISRFKYNFERGSNSSLEFLEAYSEHESEEVVRSFLRLIIERKFEECLPFLKLQAALFFLLLVILLVKIVYFPGNLMLSALIIIFNTCFFGYEMVQLKLSGAQEYFESIWNYADLLGFLLLYAVCIIDFFLKEQDKTMLSFPTALCFLLLLLRGMSYLRIFSNLRYLINMVVEIMKDMSSFMILLVYWIIGASLVFFLFVGPPEDPKEAKEYYEMSSLELFTQQMLLTYRLAFGDFNVDDYNAFQWIIFLITSLFIPLIMFNLLIAIMGDTYGRVQELSQAVDLKQKAELIAEVEGLMYWKRNTGEDKKDYLLICYDQSLGEDAMEGAQWEGKVKDMQKTMSKIEKQLSKITHMKRDIVSTLSKEIKAQVSKK